jgi:hypothetical protein
LTTDGIDVVRGDQAGLHRTADGELWLCEFEVWPLVDQTAGCEFCRQPFNRPDAGFTCPYCKKAWTAATD